jgi:transposase-like protein
MDSSKYNRKVTMHCPNCGNTKFEYDEKDKSKNRKVKCSSCKAEFTDDQLQKRNKKLIDKNIKEIEKQAVKDVETEISKMLKKFK